MKVSIITPVFNEAKNIESCFNCVVELEYGNIEWIIVDD
ncbi:TPA: glycosyltransferase, partial [Aeromonas veronii]